MAVKKDLSIKYLGVDCLNPFFLSSSPVGGNYDMVAKCYETGWGGCFFKTIGIFVADECSPRFDQTNKEGLPWLGFKNMEQISDKPTEQNFEYIYRLCRDYPEHITVASIMGSTVEEWKKLAKMADEAGAKIIEGNFSCPQMTSHDMGSDVGTNNELVESYSRAVSETVPHIPFVAKMTPNCKNMEEHARAAIKGGAAAVSAINTIKSVTNIDFENNTGMPVVNGKMLSFARWLKQASGTSDTDTSCLVSAESKPGETLLNSWLSAAETFRLLQLSCSTATES